MQVGKVCLEFVCVVAATAFGVGTARADSFGDYGLTGSFTLPASAPFDVLNDGRLVTLDNAELYAETALGSRTFTHVGTLPNADFNTGAYGGPAFIRVSPNGTRVAVGNNGGAAWNNYQVGVFALSDLSGNWFDADHFDAEWADDVNLGLTAGALAPTRVTILDTSSDPDDPTNPVVVDNIGGSSAGITFDANGNLYTGNGYQYSGPSDTGWIKAFDSADWELALTGSPLDFEAEPTLIADLLSADALGFDAEGNLHVGGGDIYGGSGDKDYGALVRHNVVARALDDLGAASPTDPDEVRKFDPDLDNENNAYDANYNFVTGELYYREGGTVYTYVVPEPGALSLLVLGGLIGFRRRVR